MFSYAVDYFWAHSDNNSSAQFPDAVSACKDYELTNEAQFGWVYDHIVMHATTAECYAQQGGPVAFRVSVRLIGNSCPAGTTYNSSTGACNKSCPAEGSSDGAPVSLQYVTKNAVHVCIASCSYGGSFQRLVSPNNYEISPPFSSDGQFCDGSGTGGGATPPVDQPKVKDNGCPVGSYATGMGISGQSICSTPEASKPTIPDPSASPNAGKTTDSGTKSTTNGDGSVTITDTKGVTNSDGSVTTNTTSCTTATDGSKSCSTSSTTGNGSNGTPGRNDRDPTTGDKKPDDAKSDPVTDITGDLYQVKTRTFAGVMSDFNSKVMAAPFIAAGTNFFVVNVNGGACPSWTAAVPYLKMSVNLGQYFCGPGTDAVFNVIGYGVLLVAAYAAFKMAFL
ncbi:hypothetical protein [Collimonas antrihumi]|uniref:hypothetical protein n=1 Tax=Collimonas antrihumi TaxID=1940615 RepID=UPI001B8C6841|nr:hypothetical protein [Collimonas antrihumi]